VKYLYVVDDELQLLWSVCELSFFSEAIAATKPPYYAAGASSQRQANRGAQSSVTLPDRNLAVVFPDPPREQRANRVLGSLESSDTPIFFSYERNKPVLVGVLLSNRTRRRRYRRDCPESFASIRFRTMEARISGFHGHFMKIQRRRRRDLDRTPTTEPHNVREHPRANSISVKTDESITFTFDHTRHLIISRGFILRE